MSKPKDGDAYGAGFKIRMGILLLILVGMGAGFAFDRAVVLPNNKKKIDEVYAMMTSDEIKKSATGMRTEMVEEKVGFKPSVFDDSEHNFKVETYSFGRGLPLMKGDELKVVSRDGAVLKLILNAEYDPTSIEAVGKVFQPPKEERLPVSIGGGGVQSRPRNQNKDKDEKEGDNEDKKDADTESEKESGDEKEKAKEENKESETEKK